MNKDLIDRVRDGIEELLRWQVQVTLDALELVLIFLGLAVLVII
tara:strand:- start:4383 stop:4514 length:132 start_codon:yes stop_codon:yes gene_type:complete